MRLTALVLIAATAGLLQWVSLPSSQPVGETATMVTPTAEPIEPVMLVNLSSQPDVGPGSCGSSPGPTPTPEPTIAPPPVETVEAATNHDEMRQRATLTESEVVAVLRAAGAPEDWVAPMVNIAWCESRFSPGAVGDGGNSLGLFQLWSGWFGPAGYSAAEAYDPLVNARVAVYVREVRGRFGGAGGWSCADLWGIP